MSWDIFIQDLPADAASVAEIPDDFIPSKIGRREELIASIKAVIPDADFSDRTFGVVDRPGCSMNISLGEEEVVECVALHASGERAPEVVSAIVQALGRRALDSQTGEFFDPRSAASSYAEWKRSSSQL